MRTTEKKFQVLDVFQLQQRTNKLLFSQLFKLSMVKGPKCEAPSRPGMSNFGPVLSVSFRGESELQNFSFFYLQLQLKKIRKK